jgi:hypothetical protein
MNILYLYLLMMSAKIHAFHMIISAHLKISQPILFNYRIKLVVYAQNESLNLVTVHSSTFVC